MTHFPLPLDIPEDDWHFSVSSHVKDTTYINHPMTNRIIDFAGSRLYHHCKDNWIEKEGRWSLTALTDGYLEYEEAPYNSCVVIPFIDSRFEHPLFPSVAELELFKLDTGFIYPIAAWEGHTHEHR